MPLYRRNLAHFDSTLRLSGDLVRRSSQLILTDKVPTTSRDACIISIPGYSGEKKVALY